MTKKKVTKSEGSLDEYMAGRPKERKRKTEVVEDEAPAVKLDPSVAPLPKAKSAQSSLQELLKKAKQTVEEIEKEEENIVVLNTFPMKDAWKKQYVEMERMAEEGQKLMYKLKTFRQHFWSTIEMETGIFDHPMRVNDAGMIEVIDRGDEKEDE